MMGFLVYDARSGVACGYRCGEPGDLPEGTVAKEVPSGAQLYLAFYGADALEVAMNDPRGIIWSAERKDFVAVGDGSSEVLAQWESEGVVVE